MGLGGDLALVLLILDSLFEHGDLVLVEVLDAVHEHSSLNLFLLLVLLEVALFFEQFVLLEVRGEFVDALAKSHLLRISLEH